MLHFYELENNFPYEPSINYQAVDVIEKPKSYEIKYPYTICRNRINKSEIGKVIPGYLRFMVILEEKNDKLAKDILYQFIKKEIDKQKKILNNLESLAYCVHK